MNKITINDAHIEILKNRRVFTNAKADFSSGWFKVGAQLDVTKPIYLESYSASFVGPNFSNMGAFSYTKSYFPNSMKIGRYCAIAAKVTVMPASHPMNRLSTVGFDYSNSAIFEYAEKDFLVTFNKSPLPSLSPLPIIENDVWIGHDVVICRGVRIGTGAVIASKSVVTKDVPSYAVVAGVPAVVKKYRFDEKLCERLLSSDWWHYKYTDFAFMNTLNPEEFLDKFENQKSNELLKQFEENRFDLSSALKEIS